MLLGGFIATRQENNEFTIFFRVVDSVAGAKIDLHLGNAVREIAVLSGIAMYKAIHSNLDTGTAYPILEGIDPVLVNLGDPHIHGNTVFYKLRMSSSILLPLGAASMGDPPEGTTEARDP